MQRIRAVHLTDAIRAAVAAAEDLREVCGALVLADGTLELVALPNRSREICTFELDPREVGRLETEAAARGDKLVGTYHSHVASRAEPGAGDVRGALGEWMLIIDACDEVARLWRIEEGRASPAEFRVVA